MISEKICTMYNGYYHVLLAALRPRNIKLWSYECLYNIYNHKAHITYSTGAHYNLSYRLIMAPTLDIKLGLGNMQVYTALLQYRSNTEMQYPKSITKRNTEISKYRKKCKLRNIFRVQHLKYVKYHEKSPKIGLIRRKRA